MLVFAGVALTAAASDILSTGKLNAVIRGYGESKNFAGVVWIQERENIIVKEAFELAHREQKLPHVIDERCRIASITKLLTAALVMKAADENIISLDKKLSEYGAELA